MSDSVGSRLGPPPCGSPRRPSVRARLPNLVGGAALLAVLFSMLVPMPDLRAAVEPPRDEARVTGEESPADGTAPEAAEKPPEGPLIGPPAPAPSKRVGGRDPSAPPWRQPAWRADKTYKYVWYQDKKRIGESLIRLERKGIVGEAGSRFENRLHVHRQRLVQGHNAVTEAVLRFDEAGRPLGYREDKQFALTSKKPFRAGRELEVEFEAQQARLIYTHNRREERAVRNEVEIDATTRLYPTNGLELWLVFAVDLAKVRRAEKADPQAEKEASDTSRAGSPQPGSKVRRPDLRYGVERTAQPAWHTVKVLYPEFAKTVDIEFSAGVETEIELGKRAVRCWRHRFQVRSWKFRGQVWVDAEGRLLQYASDSLRLTLSALP